MAGPLRGRPFVLLRGSGPISGVLSWTTIYLGRTSPCASSGYTRTSTGQVLTVPIHPCSEWGLPSRHVTVTLVRFYRTVSAFLLRECRRGVFFSVALSVASPRPAVSRHSALWSPDFPHAVADTRPSSPLHQWILAGNGPIQALSTQVSRIAATARQSC